MNYAGEPPGGHPLFGLFMFLCHYFRMHAFFLVSGFFGALLVNRRGAKEMIKNRVNRVLYPLLALSYPIWLLVVFSGDFSLNRQQGNNIINSIISGLWVFVETPTNPMLEITDIAVVSELCKKHKLQFAVDNTFMSPYGQRPIEHGADCVMHSSTKFIGGHSDVLGGILVAKDKELAERLHFIQKSGGAIPSPFDAWLLLRSVKTMAMRVQKASDNAMVLAKYFDSHAKIVKTIYPGLDSHAENKIAQKQQRSPNGDIVYGSMVSLVFESKLELDKFVNKINLFSLAESLGGVESLMSVPYFMTHADVPKEVKAEMDLVPELLRLAVGIEHIDDLTADIDQALL